MKFILNTNKEENRNSSSYFQNFVDILNEEFKSEEVNYNVLVTVDEVINESKMSNRLNLSISCVSKNSGNEIASHCFGLGITPVSCGLILMNSIPRKYSDLSIYMGVDNVIKLIVLLMDYLQRPIIDNSISKCNWSGYSKSAQMITSNTKTDDSIWRAIVELSTVSEALNPNSANMIETCITNLSGVLEKYRKKYERKVESASGSVAKST